MLPPPIVPADGQEAMTKPPANHEEATAQLLPIVPELPQIGELSPKGTMPTLVLLPLYVCVPIGQGQTSQGAQRRANATNWDWRRQCHRVSWAATKRRRCIVCGKFGHDSEGCWLLEKGENLEPAVVHTLPIAKKMEMDEEGNDGEEKEGLV